MRIDKFLCDCQIGTRSEVKKLIKSGRILVDGLAVKSPQIHIDEECSVVEFDGKRITYERFVYFLLYKPLGCVSAVSDNVHPTVMEYLKGENIKGCAPVGRLDLDTQGVLLITNDGQLAHHLISPGHHIPKTYLAVLDSHCPPEAVEAFAEGIDIGDKDLTIPAELTILDDNMCRLTIYEGRYHQVKRMFKTMGCNVVSLLRESMGTLTLDGLRPGGYRRLNTREIEEIKSKVN